MTDENHDPVTCSSCGAVNPWMNDACRLCGASLPGHDLPTTAGEREHTPPEEDVDLPHAEPSAAPESTGEVRTEQPEDPPADDHPAVPDAGSEVLERDPLETLPWSPAVRKAKRDAASPTFRPHTWNPLWILLGIVIFLALFIAGQYLIMRYVIANDPNLKAKVEQFNQQQAAALRSGDKEQGPAVSEAEAEELRAALFGNRLLVVTGVLVLLLPPLLVGGFLFRRTGALRNGAIAAGVGAAVMMLVSQQGVYALVFGALYGGLGILGGLAARKLFRNPLPPTEPS